jgi:glycosyltransferase involved in cell wall biosynthesis
MTYTCVIASYKYGHLAANCIESVLCQTKKFDKILFVDDGAGDCTHLPTIYPDLHYLLRDQNLGVVANFQDMLTRVETDMVMFVGADNWLRPDTLELISNENTDIVVYDIIVTGELRDEIRRFYPDEVHLFYGDWYWSRRGKHHGSMMFDTKFALNAGGYEHNKTSSRTDEDLNLWNKMKYAGASISHINQGLLYYRRHRENFNKY